MRRLLVRCRGEAGACAVIIDATVIAAEEVFVRWVSTDAECKRMAFAMGVQVHTGIVAEVFNRKR